MNKLSENETRDRLMTFVKDRFLAGDPAGELTDQTPLLALGILDSLNTAILMSFIKDELGASVPLEEMRARNFASIASLNSLVQNLYTTES